MRRVDQHGNAAALGGHHGQTRAIFHGEVRKLSRGSEQRDAVHFVVVEKIDQFESGAEVNRYLR